MKWVYDFHSDGAEGNGEMKELLGGKGANLAEMSNLGIPVPPGFTITTEACLDYQKTGVVGEEIRQQVLDSLKRVESRIGKTFGSGDDPLLFSVRSGAPVSMPGMMDTVLNLGLNEQSVETLAKVTGKGRFAWDSYRRFIQMYANVVMNFNLSLLETTLEDLKDARGVVEDVQLQEDDLRELVRVYKGIILQETGRSFPEDIREQLWQSIAAVFDSWNSPRAVKYRQINGISDRTGTAVNIQSMVFGNKSEHSATGVCFSRDPSTGEKKFFGEYLANAQGEDVVAGIRTPLPIDSGEGTLEQIMPGCYRELKGYVQKLEKHYRDMQDIEFTIEEGKLYILQTRNGKRTAAAAVKIAVDLVEEGVITRQQALLRVRPGELNGLLHPRLDPDVKKTVLASGLPASPGACSGKIALTAHQAQEMAEKGERVVLVRKETCPDDIGGMAVAVGILTARGGMTSHAAVVARGMGCPCVSGCSGMAIDEASGIVTIGGEKFVEGDSITLDGGSGEIFKGELPTIEANLSGDFHQFMTWVEEVPSMGVRANGDNPEDARVALNFGAKGIGLCRTEHMFFSHERILAVREMIFSKNLKERQKALEKLLPCQREDFHGIFKVMDGFPVNIRLLDPPLHEFLPESESDQKALAEYLDKEVREIAEQGEKLKEFNPMLGHRGCRLGITYPEIYRMQARAIIEAALAAQAEGVKVYPEIMIPLVSVEGELTVTKDFLKSEIEEVFREKGMRLDYKMGTMIELPRAALVAGTIAKNVDFFSFGTNDLTQTTYGISRDDAGKFMGEYTLRGIFSKDPFASIDREGVGFLVEWANREGKRSNQDIHVGICGEHGGDPESIAFCHEIGLDYVSCSPFRVPVARLAAAQAALS